jgi:hypothetical protein
MMLIGRMKNRGALPGQPRPVEFWATLWNQSWQGTTMLILPLSAILIVSLVTQVEIRANGWKQVEATPQPRATIFLGKLAVILVLLLIMLAWLNLGLVGAAFGPSLVVPGAPRPTGAFPIGLFLERTAVLFVDTLPLIALQYLLALQSKSFLVPLGLGVAIWIASISTLSWEYRYLFPYAYAAIQHGAFVDPQHTLNPPMAIPGLATLVFLAASAAGYVGYHTKSDRG